MADAAPQRYLSYPAILTLAANTMNGPGITTLPNVAGDAGLFLYIALIFLSVSMAAFVCRRMVYAMWSSLGDNNVAGEYESMIGVESGVMQSLAISNRESIDVGTDEFIPDAKLEAEGLTHREQERGHQDPPADDESEDEGHDEAATLLTHEESEQNAAAIAANRLQPSLERTSIVGQSREAYGKQTSVYVALTMVASALALGLAQMMLCAAILDGMFVAVGGKSCAIGWPSPATDESPSSWIHCTTHSSMKPYLGSGAPTSLLSIGWAIAATASVAMGTVALDEMMAVQYFLFACLVISAVRFSAVLKGMGDALENGTMGNVVDEASEGSSAVSWFVGPSPFQTVGPIMLNFAFVVTSPPSSAMAKRESIAYRALGMSCVVMGTLYTMVGTSGARVSNAVRSGLIEGADDSNLLSLILLSGGDDGPSVLDLCIIALFGFSTVASVPVYCLLAKETLINDAGVAPLPSFLLSNVLPWILVALTYNAAFFEAFVNWSGLLILGYANFSIPLLLDLKLKKVRWLRAMSKGSKAHDDDTGTTAMTKGVFVLVTASITLVIVQSISGSLILSLVAFVFAAGLMSNVQV